MTPKSIQDITELSEVAMRLAPAFRDKYDFSEDSDYDKLAERAYRAAEAMIDYRNQLLAELPVVPVPAITTSHAAGAAAGSTGGAQ